MAPLVQIARGWFCRSWKQAFRHQVDPAILHLDFGAGRDLKFLWIPGEIMWAGCRLLISRELWNLCLDLAGVVGRWVSSDVKYTVLLSWLNLNGVLIRLKTRMKMKNEIF